MSSWKVELRDRCKRWRVRRAYWKRHKEGRVPKKEKSPRAEMGAGGGGAEGMSILDETRRVVEDSPLLPPFSFIPSSAVSSFSVTPCSSSRWLPFVPARCNEGTKTSRRLRRSGDRETEALPALAHRTLWYRHRGLPFTLHLFYFIFRGINVFGALPVG